MNDAPQASAQQNLKGAIRLRAATVDDLDAIAGIEESSFPDPWSRTGLASLLRLPPHRTWVAVCPSSDRHLEVNGFLSIRLQSPEAEILRLAVRLEARRRGIGAKLLSDAIGASRRAGVTAIYLEVRAENQPALALYRSRGFRLSTVRRRYYSNGEDAFVLWREVEPLSGFPG